MKPTPLPPGSENGPAGKGTVPQRPLPRLSLVYYPNPILRAVCQPVDRFDSAFRDLVQEMFGLMEIHAGIGLAGPQVALEQRVLVCSIQGRTLCLTNPEIHQTDEPDDLVEGCLSLPNIQVTVRRPQRIQVSGYDEHGRKKRFGASGLWARVIQHELDHLNGVLICDRGHAGTESCNTCSLQVPAVPIEKRKRRLQRARGSGASA